jgi:hypothetical protein
MGRIAAPVPLDSVSVTAKEASWAKSGFVDPVGETGSGSTVIVMTEKGTTSVGVSESHADVEIIAVIARKPKAHANVDFCMDFTDVLQSCFSPSESFIVGVEQLDSDDVGSYFLIGRSFRTINNYISPGT